MKSSKRQKANEHEPEPVGGCREESVEPIDFENAVEAGSEGGAPDEESGEWASASDADPALNLEADLMKWRELAMRTSADLENYRKRVGRDREEAIRYANQGLLEELLPILDHFEMGMQAAAGEENSMIYIGMDMVRKQFAEFLAAHGLTPVEVTPGGEFDHSIHEAVAEEPSEEIGEGRVLRVMRCGFMIRGRLLRPATVVVSSGPAMEEDNEEKG